MSDRYKQVQGKSVTNPMHQNSVKITQLRDDIKEQDDIIVDIEMGVDDLGVLANNMNTLGKEQDILVTDLGKNVDESNDRVKFVTGMVKKVIEKSGGECRCVIIVFLVVILLGLLMIMVFA